MENSSMQILYGNDGTNYCVIAKSKNVTDKILYEIENRGLLFYNFPKGEYGSPETEPISFCYIPSSLNGIFPEDFMIIAQAKRMSNRKTPSYYVHVQITPMPDLMADMDLCEMLERKFIQDIDMMKYKEEDIDNFKFMAEEKEISKKYTFDKNEISIKILKSDKEKFIEVEKFVKIETSEDALEEDQIRAILRLLYKGLEFLGSPVIIILDQDGDAYNNRAKEIIFTIYKYIPCFLKGKIGFCTYYSLGSSKIDGVQLVLVEKGTDCKSYKNVIDLNKKSYEEIKEEKHEVEQTITYMLNKDSRISGMKIHAYYSYKNMKVTDGLRVYATIKKVIDTIKTRDSKKVRKEVIKRLGSTKKIEEIS